MVWIRFGSHAYEIARLIRLHDLFACITCISRTPRTKSMTVHDTLTQALIWWLIAIMCPPAVIPDSLMVHHNHESAICAHFILFRQGIFPVSVRPSNTHFIILLRVSVIYDVKNWDCFKETCVILCLLPLCCPCRRMASPVDLLQPSHPDCAAVGLLERLLLHMCIIHCWYTLSCPNFCSADVGNWADPEDVPAKL